MAKCIPINSCKDCPSKDHKGAFGLIAYVPVCQKMHGKELPYAKYVPGNKATARSTGEIPEWCPLDDYHIIVETGVEG